MNSLIQFGLLIVVFAMGTLGIATALTPGMYLVLSMWEHTLNSPEWLRVWLLCLVTGIAFLGYGLTLMAITVASRNLIKPPSAGTYAFGSHQSILWFLSGVLPFLVAKTFLDYLSLSEIKVIYFRLMGAKIGRNVTINTKDISDYHMLTIGDNTLIGGDVKLIGHLGERGKLKLRPINIGKQVTIGDSTLVMPGVEIEDGASIGAGSVLLKDTKVPAKAIFIGVPARNIRFQITEENPLT